VPEIVNDHALRLRSNTSLHDFENRRLQLVTTQTLDPGPSCGSVLALTATLNAWYKCLEHFICQYLLNTSTFLCSPQWHPETYPQLKKSSLRSPKAGHQTLHQISGSCITTMFTISKLEARNQLEATRDSKLWSTTTKTMHDSKVNPKLWHSSLEMPSTPALRAVSQKASSQSLLASPEARSYLSPANYVQQAATWYLCWTP